MCYEFDRLYWQHRAEEARREAEKAARLKKEDKPAPAKPAAPEAEPRTREPVPA